MADKLKVFVSWSGNQGKSHALIWADMIREMFDNVEPFVSDRDIEAGVRPLEQIRAELEDTRIGLVVVTKSHQNSTWLNFEAGALSRQVDSSKKHKVMAVLVGFESINELEGPINQFQVALFGRDGVSRILASVASEVDLSWSDSEKRFGRMWAEYSDRFNAVPEEVAPAAGPTRSERDLLEEVLQLVRDMRRDGYKGAHAPSSQDNDFFRKALRAVVTAEARGLGKGRPKARLSRSVRADGVYGMQFRAMDNDDWDVDDLVRLAEGVASSSLPVSTSVVDEDGEEVAEFYP